MTASTTHDTKRSEDARARIAVLAEIPDEWEAALDELLRLAPLPDPAFGSLLWQAVLGAWPAPRATACTRTPRRRCARPATGPPGPSPTLPTRPPCTRAVDAAFDDERVADRPR